MKKLLGFVLIMVVTLVGNVSAATVTVVADFDTGDSPNNLNGAFGGWDKDPFDDDQTIEMYFESDDALGDPSGYAIRLDYDVEASGTAYNGFWMKLNGFDATPYNILSFYIRGDKAKGFTKSVKLELKDMRGYSSSHTVRGITHQWKKVKIPLYKFRRLEEWKRLNEFVIVFEDTKSKPQVGRVFIDHVAFEKK